eukprot:CAMPEP_0172518786 /NCGR_PEP_ID=MMETSP1066-20121228/291023_1 /TAXON_ID=671091 /ORGANISM="Coscinodiscus wailesii, Strain CCMP2513" /LENGTH=490 /DNA_ID=CAMNT_0013301233 /DNA_START=66 /DNA_END=1537 /DNA_ORIENTATION=-
MAREEPQINQSSINVAIRLRPLNNRESSSSKDNEDRAWRALPETNSIVQLVSTPKKASSSPKLSSTTSPVKDPFCPAVSIPQGGGGGNSSSVLFTFDRTFGEDATTEDVYNSVAKGIVNGVVSGINGTIFAYGQTSSGKTFTMQGSQEDNEIDGNPSRDGIIQMAARDIFAHVSSNHHDPHREYLVRISFLEIYNEQVRDLLSKNNEGESLAVREDPKQGVVVNCTEVVVTDLASLLNVLRDGEKHRQVASTNMNETSSRSHTIFRVTIESREVVEKDDDDSCDDEGGVGAYFDFEFGRFAIESREVVEKDDDDSCDDEGGSVLISTLNLVDLAGSESVKHTGATGQRQREGGMINQSLLSLSQVINTLASSKKQFVNYRDSKLTRLLQPSLSGNALMSIICCVTPSRHHIEETKSTLKFAARAKLVKVKAQKNEVIGVRVLVKRLQKEMTKLRKDMEEQKKKLKKQRRELKLNGVINFGTCVVVALLLL